MNNAKKTLRLAGGISSIILNAVMLLFSIMLFLVSFVFWLGQSWRSVDEEAMLAMMLGTFLLFFPTGTSIITGIMLCANKGVKTTAVMLTVTNLCAAMLEFMFITNLIGITAGVLSVSVAGVMIAFLCVSTQLEREMLNFAEEYTYNQIQFECKHLFPNGSLASEPSPSPLGDLSVRIDALDKLKAEGELTNEEYKELLRKELNK